MGSQQGNFVTPSDAARYASGPAAGLLGVNNTQEFNNQADAQARLQNLLRYDPNASIRTNTTTYGGEGGGGGGNTTYSLDFDQSKLPAISPQVQQLLSATHNFDERYIPQGLEGQNLQDPNYGNVTVPTVDRSFDWGTLAPMAILALSGIGAAGIPGILGGAAAANGIGAAGISAVRMLPNVMSMLNGSGAKSAPAFNNPTGQPQNALANAMMQQQPGMAPQQQLMQLLQRQNRV
jgi:hypothetical protein